MTLLSPDIEGFFLSLRRPLAFVSGDVIPAASVPFDIEAELAEYRKALNTALSRIPGQHLERFRLTAIQHAKEAKTSDDRRAYKRQAQIVFDHMASRGLKPVGPSRLPEPNPALEFLAIRQAVYALLSLFVPDEELIEANRAATAGWMAVKDPDNTDRVEQVGYHALQAESRLYMEIMDKNGTTERFLARQPGRAH